MVGPYCCFWFLPFLVEYYLRCCYAAFLSWWGGLEIHTVYHSFMSLVVCSVAVSCLNVFKVAVYNAVFNIFITFVRNYWHIRP